MAYDTDTDSRPSNFLLEARAFEPNLSSNRPEYNPYGLLDPLPAAVNAAALERSAKEAAELAASRAEFAAQNRRAQEALVANPAEMRKQFPRLLKDMEDTFPMIMFYDDLNQSQIEAGLKSNTLSQQDKNLLTVMKAGYNVLSEGPSSKRDDNNHLTSSQLGISAASLAVVDKAMNRDINEDPYADHGVSISGAVIKAVASGAATFAITKNTRTALVAAASGAVLSIGDDIISPILFRHSGAEKEVYDHVKEDYLTFSDAFTKSAPGK